MRVDAFDFGLPRHFIASRPTFPRDSARLLVVGDGLRDMRVRDLPTLLEHGDLLVLNDSRVIPARLVGRRGAARVEVTLHQRAARRTWLAFARPARRLRPGDEVVFGEGFRARILGKGEGGEVRLRFPLDGAAFREALAAYGLPPLPPYIDRPGGPDARDREDYQTVYATRDGSVAAPTAGLHFTRELFLALRDRGVSWATITLHVGAGTFVPVKVANTRDHRLHPERGRLPAATARAINRTRVRGGRVVAVGTTSLRLIETAAADTGEVRPFAGGTDLFITPGYRFKAVDLLLTNFHLPRSTLFMLACAFAGMERMHAAYEHAMRVGYRFYSYGDCTLLFRTTP
ncbi:MAG: tRNA preQ1(34) S-adenosylmethionine ribosyltransferase-isomerase QueA [Alphaproteobacteria bacterium]